MKVSCTFLLLFIISCGQRSEEAQVTSSVDCIIPLVVPQTHFAHEDSITVTPIQQLR
ncbi:hypothetical protein R1T16_16205 [Flavobacterium sp. DG1-102-2]|uniref:hypothetical protein n=1 Tax=Flavobacterium sp. DG1-102-2 TaxID=3081663 RepID=UPI00294A7B77|nr:hypothetical protein [Flavobacterium sp. DG1-102-2]MDV6169982.1 hypothetical protein [Flavobacterium sp. DG1-102-2]